MAEQRTTPGRLEGFSDAVFAVIITIMVLDLKTPDRPSLLALLPLWPTALSYAVSYLFIAIIWINHCRLLDFAHEATPKLVWWNFAHLFMVSLVPVATAWIAETRLAAAPVFVYAAVFVLINIAFLSFQEEAVAQASETQVTPAIRRITRIRAYITLGIFATAAAAAYWHPLLGFGLVCSVLFIYLQPRVPGEY